MNAKLYVALVTPFSWTVPSAVNQHVASLAVELKARGHLPVVLTSSDDPRDVTRARSLFRVARGQVINMLSAYREGEPADQLLLPFSVMGSLDPEDGIPVIPMGSSFPFRLSGAVTNLGLPVDITSRVERLMIGGQFDLIHVHEPVAPSVSFTALREARSPVVATFHSTPLGVAGYGMAQSVLDRFFDRLDARIVTFESAAEIMSELYPGDYQVIPGGTRLRHCGPGPTSETTARPSLSLEQHGRYALYVYRGDARRSYRALLRALVTAFPTAIDRVVVAMHRPSTARWVPRPTPRKLRDRLQLLEFSDSPDLQALYEGAAVVVLPYLGGEWLPTTMAEAAVCGRPVVGPDVVPVADLLSGLGPDVTSKAIFLPGSSDSLRKSVDALLGEPAEEFWPPDAGKFCMGSVAGEVEQIYNGALAATSARKARNGMTPIAGHSLQMRGIGELSPRRRARGLLAGSAKAGWINADLHVHSNYSKDSVSTIESILATAREVGLGALAIADHNEIDGALLARELCGGDPFVIVAEEVKTSEGEVIGLFLEKAIPKGLSFDETLSLIKEQGGLVYVPHPFDALRTTPSYRSMVDNLHRIDVIEIYNAKVALSSFNMAAERFAAKYNVVAGAGSDSHVLQGLGTAMLRMPHFHDPASFLAALWEADIIAKRKNLLYLQSLKLLQTTLDRVLTEE